MNTKQLTEIFDIGPTDRWTVKCNITISGIKYNEGCSIAPISIELQDTNKNKHTLSELAQNTVIDINETTNELTILLSNPNLKQSIEKKSSMDNLINDIKNIQ